MFCRCGRKRKQIPLLIASNFPCHCSFTYLLLPSICARTEENVETVNDLVLSQADKPRPTELSVKYHGKRVFIGRLRTGLFVRTYIWNVSRGTVHRSWQTRTALLAWSALNFCFRSSRSMPLTLFSLWTKKRSQSLHLTIGRTKSLTDYGNFWAFSSVRELHALSRCLAACFLQYLQNIWIFNIPR